MQFVMVITINLFWQLSCVLVLKLFSFTPIGLHVNCCCFWLCVLPTKVHVGE
jgi:hypothetical protein